MPRLYNGLAEHIHHLDSPQQWYSMYCTFYIDYIACGVRVYFDITVIIRNAGRINRGSLTNYNGCPFAVLDAALRLHLNLIFGVRLQIGDEIGGLV